MVSGKEIAIKYLKEIYSYEIKLSYAVLFVCGGSIFFIVHFGIAIGYNVLALLIYWKYRIDRKNKLNEDIERINNTTDD